MAEPKDKLPHWVDCLHGKHECYSYDEPAVVTVDHAGTPVEVVVPDYLADVRVFVTAESDGMLFCFGRTGEKYGDRYCGLVMVGKKVADRRYEVGVWHELYPWALTHFGFEGEMT